MVEAAVQQQLGESDERGTREAIASASIDFAERLDEVAGRVEQGGGAAHDVDCMRGAAALCRLLACAAEKAIDADTFVELGAVYAELGNKIGELTRVSAGDVAPLVLKVSELVTAATKVTKVRPTFAARAGR